MSNSSGITIADVAKAAGVSVSTVSRILNGKQDVAPSTRERVQQVIEALGFMPHAQAQGLRAGKTQTIALLFPYKFPGHPSYNALETEFIIGAAAAAGENGFFFSLITAPMTKHSLLNLYRSAQVDGLVLMQIHTSDWRADLLREHHYPFVMIGHCDDNTHLRFVDLDFEASITTAFDHLVSLGHQRVGFLALPAELRHKGYGPAVRGWMGYEKALSSHQLTAAYREVGYEAKDIFQATHSLLDEQPELTAIVTAHELASLSVIQVLTERGRCVPQDFSLVALMTERIAELSTPPLTHVEFPAHDMGYKAVDILVRTLKGDNGEPGQILIPPRLIVRNSTAPVVECHP